MTESKSAIAEAIARHKAAQAAYDAAAANNSDARDQLGVECEALDTLAATPCANDGELIVKLAYLIKRETDLWGNPFESGAEFVSLAQALALHFEWSGEDTAAMEV